MGRSEGQTPNDQANTRRTKEWGLVLKRKKYVGREGGTRKSQTFSKGEGGNRFRGGGFGEKKGKGNTRAINYWRGGRKQGVLDGARVSKRAAKGRARNGGKRHSTKGDKEPSFVVSEEISSHCQIIGAGES